MKDINIDEPVMIDEVQKAKEYRLKLDISQVEFAERFGLPLQTYVQWERGRRQPEMSAKVLLSLIVNSPDEVVRIVRRGKRREMARSLMSGYNAGSDDNMVGAA